MLSADTVSFFSACAHPVPVAINRETHAMILDHKRMRELDESSSMCTIFSSAPSCGAPYGSQGILISPCRTEDFLPSGMGITISGGILLESPEVPQCRVPGSKRSADGVVGGVVVEHVRLRGVLRLAFVAPRGVIDEGLHVHGGRVVLESRLCINPAVDAVLGPAVVRFRVRLSAVFRSGSSRRGSSGGYGTARGEESSGGADERQSLDRHQILRLWY